MRIERVAFGQLVIDGTTYQSDLLVFPDGRVVDGWRRLIGHVLDDADIDALAAQSPAVIVVGTGIYGRLRPAPGLAARLAAAGIELSAAPNAEAAAIFNRQAGMRRLAAAFHLTC